MPHWTNPDIPEPTIGDPGYFTQPISEALTQAGAQMKTIITETSEYNGNSPAFWRHQILEMAQVVSFLGALVAAQHQEAQTKGEV